MNPFFTTDLWSTCINARATHVYLCISLNEENLEFIHTVLSHIFSNSLIIRQIKTKKITTVKEVWIPGLNKHRFWRFCFSVNSLDFVSIEKMYSRKCFIGYPNTRWNTVPRVWYITPKMGIRLIRVYPGL